MVMIAHILRVWQLGRERLFQRENLKKKKENKKMKENARYKFGFSHTHMDT